jgi:hypothetical protein
MHAREASSASYLHRHSLSDEMWAKNYMSRYLRREDSMSSSWSNTSSSTITTQAGQQGIVFSSEIVFPSDIIFSSEIFQDFLTVSKPEYAGEHTLQIR